MVNVTAKRDPIRSNYYTALENAERWGDVLFYIAAVISLVALLVEKAIHPLVYDIAQIAFVLSVVMFCTISVVTRIYFTPRAQKARYQDFLSHAYEFPLVHEQTTGYYNNTQTLPSRRLAAQLLENSFYSKDTVSQMLRWERLKVGGYFIIWLIIILTHRIDLAIVAIAAQVVFSEQILSRWMRMEWLRIHFEDVYDRLFRLIKDERDAKVFEVTSLEQMGRYEIAKANAAITLSQKIFLARQPITDAAWAQIVRQLAL